MTPIKKVITKNGKVQYHEYKLRQLRSFRISAANAEIQLATGKSYLVEKFWYEQTEEVKEEIQTIEEVTPVTETKVSNVVNFADKLKVKKDIADLEKAKNHFLNNILPKMTMEEKQNILFNPNTMQEILLDVMLRVNLESIK